jgi:tetratricopeptide (TPR) repeat protein
MKKLILLGLLVAAGGGTTLYFGLEDDKLQATAESKRATEQQEISRTNEYLVAFNKAGTVEEVRVLLSKLESLPPELQEKVTPAVKLRLAILNFQEAERLLNRARQLQAALTPPQPQSLPPPPPPIHPQAMELLQKAIPLYEEAKKDVDRLSDRKDNPSYNFLLNYTKGEVYHRHLMLFGNEETAKELFSQAVTYYKMALRHKPGDTDTVINIELLIRDGEGMGQGPQQQRNRLLNQQPGSGRSKGN